MQLKKLTLQGYVDLNRTIEQMPSGEQHSIKRILARNDLFFLCTNVFGRQDMMHPWLLDRCWEVQLSPNNRMDLWAREHYKSTIITFALTIQDILSSHGEDPDPKWKGIEPTFGIFSHTRPIAKKFLRQIKFEFEQNETLKALFPDVLYTKPEMEAPVWSQDDGIVVRRKSNPKESTVEAWGLVDSQPTGAHFHTRVYDDVVTRTSVQTPDAIRKTTEAWELSLNLAQRGGTERYIGTRYHFNDTYAEMFRRDVATARLYPATSDGKPEGPPVFLDAESLASKRRKMGSYTFACQMLQNPKGDDVAAFDRDDLRYYKNETGEDMNIYMLVDPASSKKKESDYTALFVIGLADDQNYYVLDMVRDRLNLAERVDLVIEKHREWMPIAVGYERYGMQADVEAIFQEQERQRYRFPIIELGGTLGNLDRVRRLLPTVEEHRWYLPESLHYTDYEGKKVDLTHVYLEEEFYPFPVGVHVDMMDAQSRIFDEKMKAVFPKPRTHSRRGGKIVPINRAYTRRRGDRPSEIGPSTSWIV